MAGRSSPFVIGVVVAVALGLGAVWLLFAAGHVPEQRPSAAGGAGANEPAHAGGPAVPRPGAAFAVDPGSPAPRADPGPTGARGANPVGLSAAAPRPPPDEGPDAAAWQKAKVAFRVRELGSMGPYVRTGLDAARRDMEFCFRQAGGASAGAQAPGAETNAPAPLSDPAVLLLYLEAREGEIDVIDTRIDHLGGAMPEVVECCREVLRGLVIPAFNTVPGQRYRVKYQLE